MFPIRAVAQSAYRFHPKTIKTVCSAGVLVVVPSANHPSRGSDSVNPCRRSKCLRFALAISWASSALREARMPVPPLRLRAYWYSRRRRLYSSRVSFGRAGRPSSWSVVLNGSTVLILFPIICFNPDPSALTKADQCLGAVVDKNAIGEEAVLVSNLQIVHAPHGAGVRCDSYQA